MLADLAEAGIPVPTTIGRELVFAPVGPLRGEGFIGTS
jgi:hypothetical protein